MIGVLRGKAEELVSLVVPSVLVVPAVLKGPDFHLDAHIYERDGGITGSLYRGSEKLTIRLEGDMTRPFFFRCLLGEYSRAYSRPSFEKLRRIVEGDGEGRPLALNMVGLRFRGEFSFDTGPSLYCRALILPQILTRRHSEFLRRISLKWPTIRRKILLELRAPARQDS